MQLATSNGSKGKGRRAPHQLRSHRRAAISTAAAGVIAVMHTSAWGASASWLGITNGSWATATNWSANPVPGTGDTATFNGTANGNTTLDLGSGVTINSISFASSTVYTIGAGAVSSQTLTLNSGGTLSVNNNGTEDQIASSVVLSGPYTITDTAGSLNLLGPISGTGNLTFNGAASYTYLGSATNTFTGSIAISNGANLSVSNFNNAFGADSNSFNFTGSGGVISNFTTSGSGTNGGVSLTIGASRSITIASGANAAFSVGYGSSSSPLTFTINSVISGAGNLQKSNNSYNSLILTAANTFTGTTSWTTETNSGAGGYIQLANALALQNSTLTANWATASGNGVTFNNTTSGGSSYTIGGLTGAGSIALTDLNSNAVALSVGNNNSTQYYSGTLSGTGGSLIKIGTGNLGLQGSATYTGGTTVSAGVLGVGLSSATNISNGSYTYTGSNTNPLGTGPIVIAAGASFELDLSGNMSLSNNITLNGVSYGTNTGNGHTATNNGVFDGALVGGTVNTETTTLSGTITLNATSNFSASWSDKIIDITGQVTGAGGLIVDPVGASRNGTVLQLGNNTNNYQGSTTISPKGAANTAPILQTTAANVIPSVSTVNDSGQLDLDGNHSQAFDALTGNGVVTSSASGTPTVSIGNAGGSGTFSGTIQNGSATSVALVKTGVGTESLIGTNTYSGGSKLSGGLLNVGSTQSVTSGPLGSLSAGGITLGGGTLQFSSANHFDYSPYFSTAASQAYNIDTNGQTVNFASPLTSSGGTLTKTGFGQLTLNGNNTYGGTTAINGGDLLLAAANLSSSSVTVGSGTYLTATGNGSTTGVISGGVSVSANSSIDFRQDGATSSAQTLSVGTLTLTTGTSSATDASLGFNLTGASLSDRITVGGNVTLGSSGNVIINLSGAGVSGNYTLVTYAGQTGQSAPGTTQSPAAGPFVLGALPSGLFTSTLNDTSTALTLQVSANATPAVAYWYGGYAASAAGGGNNTTGTWGGNNGNASSPVTNWSSNSQGTQDAGQVPGSTTDVVFTASNITSGATISTTLEGNYTINSLTVNNVPGSVTIGGSGNLTLNAAAGTLYTTAGTGILINSGAGPLTISTSGQLAAGASQTWTNSSSNTFSVTSGIGGTATNGNTTTVTLDNTSSGGTTLSGQITNGSLGGQLALTINNSGSGVTTLSNAENLFSGATTVSSGTLDVNTSQALLNSTLTPAGGNVVFGSGIGSFTIGGLSGSANLSLTDAGNGPVALSIGNNNANTTYSGTFTGTGSVTKIGTGALQLGSAPTLQTPTITLSTGSLAFSPGIGTFTFGGLSGSGNLALQDTSSQAVTVQVGNNNTNTYYSGSISGAGGLTKIGTGVFGLQAAASYAGGTIVSSGVLGLGLPSGENIGGGSATFTGSTTNPLGSGPIVVAAGASLELNPNNVSLSNNITLNGVSYGTGTGNGHTATNTGVFDGALVGGTVGTETTTLSGTITLNATSNFSANYSDKLLLLSGQLTGVGGLIVDPVGAGRAGTVLELSNPSNNYQGSTTISPQAAASSPPVLETGAVDVIPTTSTVIANGILDLYGNSQAFDALSGSGSVSSTGAGTQTLSIGNNNGTGAFSGTISDFTTIQYSNVTSRTGSGTIALIKVGTGAQTLSGSSSYSGGTTVSGGTLFANNATSSLGTGVVSVNGGLLAGNGVINNGSNQLTIAGGRIGAGATATATGTLTTGSQTWNSGGLTIKVNDTGNSTDGSVTGQAGAAGSTTGWDQVVMSALSLGSNLSSSPFAVTLTGNQVADFSGAASYLWPIAQITSGTPISTGTVLASTNANGTNAPVNGEMFTLDTSNFVTNNPSATAGIFYLEAMTSGSGETLDIGYTATPEPRTMILVLAGTMPILTARRRRGQNPAK